MQDQISGAAVAMLQDTKAAFKIELEALDITEYQSALANIEAELLATATRAADGPQALHYREDRALRNQPFIFFRLFTAGSRRWWQ